MSGERIETAGELDALPLGSAIVDRQGDTWMLDARYSDGITLWVSPETSRGASGWVAKHYAPFAVVYRPDRDLIAEAEARGAREALLDFAAHFEKHGGPWGRMGVVEYVRGEYLDAAAGGSDD